MIIQQSIGPQASLSAGGVSMRACSDGSTVTSDGHARYMEAVAQGSVFTGATATVATFGTALTSTNVTIALSNPAGSGVYAVIWKGTASVVTSSTAGSLVWAACVNPVAAIVTYTTKIVAYNCLLGSSKLNTCQLAASSALITTPVLLRPFAFGPVTATASTGNIVDEVAGEFILTPGTSITIQGITIVGTGLLGLTWEEIPATFI